MYTDILRNFENNLKYMYFRGIVSAKFRIYTSKSLFNI